MARNILKMIGLRIRDIRKTKGWSQEYLGEVAGFHFSYIGGIERAEKNISVINLEKIAVALEVPIYELFRFTKISEDYVSDKDIEMEEILSLLVEQDAKKLKKAKIILHELFSIDD